MYVIGVLVVMMQLFAVLVPHWGKKGDTYIGLWQGCFEKYDKNVSVDICVDLDKMDEKDPNFPKHALKACRSLALLSLLFSFVALMCMVWCHDKKHVIAVLGLLSGVCALLAISVWASKMMHLKGYNTKPCVSWYLMMVSGLVMLGVSARHLWNERNVRHVVAMPDWNVSDSMSSFY